MYFAETLLGRARNYVWWKGARVNHTHPASPFLQIHTPQAEAGPDWEVFGDKSSWDLRMRYFSIHILYSTPA